ncbi:alpha/beta-hydrolase [Testicularia cyperi]|uniref:Alpha/beta-hydrolase n=1 Tax=Testicularia cyperi TaxID=1882483 RepID=A0A317XVA1_9BASI|nr:alpha/beta-hydrolase [Testicularia cyperi]
MNDTSPFPYHESVQAWYDLFLKVALERKAWPVDEYAVAEDFGEIFVRMAAQFPNTAPNEIGEDDWAESFLPKAEELYSAAEELNAKGQAQEAASAYMRSANVYRLAYFPWVHMATSRSDAKRYAWQMDKVAFERAIDVGQTFTSELHWLPWQSSESKGPGRMFIPIFAYLPAAFETPRAVVLIITGLDHYHTYMLEQITKLTSYGLAVVVTPMPGTADSPITGNIPSVDKTYWTTILDWIESHHEGLDAGCVSVWGISTGSYWAIKASRFLGDRIRRAVSQGTASHYTFSRTWLEAAEKLAYPLSLQTALGRSFGFYDPEDFKSNVQQYSLLDQGLLDMNGALVVGVNGEGDTIFPIDDQRILLEHGPGALLRWFPHMGHNGEPLSSAWLYQFWQDHGACNK